MEMIIEKTLVTSDGKKFNLFDDIAFTILNNETNHLDRVIGRIIALNDLNMVVDNVEINRCNEELTDKFIFYYDDMENVNYVV